MQCTNQQCSNPVRWARPGGRRRGRAPRMRGAELTALAWQRNAACRHADSAVFFAPEPPGEAPSARLRRLAGQAGLRALPGPAGVPRLCAGERGGVRRVGRAERGRTEVSARRTSSLTGRADHDGSRTASSATSSAASTSGTSAEINRSQTTSGGCAASAAACRRSRVSPWSSGSPRRSISPSL